MLLRVLVAIETPTVRNRVQRILEDADVVLSSTKISNGRWEEVLRENPDLLIVAETLLPSPFAESIQALRAVMRSVSIVVLSDREDAERRASLLASGCEAVLFSGLPVNRLQPVLAAIIEKLREQALKSLEAGRSWRPSLADFSSASPVMQNFLQVVKRVVDTGAPLVVLGETGVGKEWLSKAIHSESSRSAGPFVAVNCGALPETLLESELFGHEKGAFTGAVQARRGFFEMAHRGTIFLDEIAEMPYHLQVKLLRVLQDSEVQRLGSERVIKVDVRVIAASNRDLAKEVETNRFRRDLYYRLSVLTLTVPPLRERREDIPVLADAYISRFMKHARSTVQGVTPEAMDALCEYHWPGNVRELINVIERAMLLCNNNEIRLEDLPGSISGFRNEVSVPGVVRTTEGGALSDSLLDKPLGEARRLVLDVFEKTYLSSLLSKTRGKISETARLAGIRPRSLFDKMKRFGLRKEDFRRDESARR